MTSRALSSADLVGTWRLLSWSSIGPDGVTSKPFGDEPVGYLLYSGEGYVSGNMMPARRPGFEKPRLTSTDVDGGSPAEIIAAFNSYSAYAGTYRFDPASSTVEHQVLCGLQPDWTGSVQIRTVTLRPDGRLEYRTKPVEVRDGSQYGVLVWERVTSNAVPADDESIATSPDSGVSRTQG